MVIAFELVELELKWLILPLVLVALFPGTIAVLAWSARVTYRDLDALVKKYVEQGEIDRGEIDRLERRAKGRELVVVAMAVAAVVLLVLVF